MLSTLGRDPVEEVWKRVEKLTQQKLPLAPKVPGLSHEACTGMECRDLETKWRNVVDLLKSKGEYDVAAAPTALEGALIIRYGF